MKLVMRVKEANRFFFTQNPLEMPKYYKYKNPTGFSLNNEGSGSTMADDNMNEGPKKLKDTKLYPEDTHEGF